MNTATIRSKNYLLVKCILMAVMLQGCAMKLWPFGSESSDQEPVSSEAPIALDGEKAPASAEITKPQKKASPEGLELKQAKIWNRLDDLEEQIRVQKEQIKVLEQGLLTGIPPESLRSKRKAEASTKDQKDGESETSLLSKPKIDQVKVTNVSTSSSSDPDSYKVRIQVAKDYFQASRFGLAVAELAQIIKLFGEKAGEGEARFFLGRSYLGLKEYLTARTELETFIREFPNSNMNGVARLELARAYVGLNLGERARTELSKVAREYEGKEEGDIAVNDLKGLRGNL
jgi:TolA-binding protein